MRRGRSSCNQGSGLVEKFLPTAIDDVRLVARNLGSIMAVANDLQYDMTDPDEIATAVDYFFFGWEDVQGSWLINRQTRANAQVVRARVGSNPAYPVFADAWLAREALVYA